MFILICDKIKDFSVLFPEEVFESHYNLIENTKSDAADGWPVGWRQARDKRNHPFFQYSQRNTYNNLFTVELSSILGGHFNHISRVINASYEMIEVDFSLFAASLVKSF